MELLAGFVAFTQDTSTLAVRPKIGWAVREAGAWEPDPLLSADDLGTALQKQPQRSADGLGIFHDDGGDDLLAAREHCVDAVALDRFGAINDHGASSIAHFAGA